MGRLQMKFQIAKTGWWRCGLVWALDATLSATWRKDSTRLDDHRLIGFFIGPFYFTIK